MMRRTGGMLLIITGVLTCPCHLIVTLPLLAFVLAGTALGSFLTRNTGLVFIFADIYFIVALLLGYWLLFGPARRMSNMEEACLTCAPAKTIPKRSEKVDNVSAIRSVE
jgi:mercuric ion transport protein